MPVSIDRIIRSKRRTVALIVEDHGSVTVRAPMRLPESAIQEFAEKHIQWVEEKAEMRAVPPPSQKQYQPGETFLYLGKEYPLEVVPTQRQQLILDDRFKIAELLWRTPNLFFKNGIVNRQVSLSPIGLQFCPAPSTSLRADQDHIRPHTLGSCSPKNTLSFSWRLMLTPPEVIDYVIIHELAHTVHHNHSKRFGLWLKNSCQITRHVANNCVNMGSSPYSKQFFHVRMYR